MNYEDRFSDRLLCRCERPFGSFVYEQVTAVLPWRKVDGADDGE